jgi:hypothetical protein
VWGATIGCRWTWEIAGGATRLSDTEKGNLVVVVRWLAASVVRARHDHGLAYDELRIEYDAGHLLLLLRRRCSISTHIVDAGHLG